MQRFFSALLALLRDPRLKRLAIAGPERAPYGRAWLTAENIAQAAQLADSGNADAGLISLTSALTPTLKSAGAYFAIPRNLYPPIEQDAVVVMRSPLRDAAHTLLNFLLSAPIQAELAKGGLTPAQ